MPEITKDAAVEVEIELVCARCSSSLDSGTTVEKGLTGDEYFSVDPCQTCLDKTRGEGHEDGYRTRDEEG